MITLGQPWKSFFYFQMGTGACKNSETCMEICWELLGTVFLADMKHTELVQCGLRFPPAATREGVVPQLLQQPGKQEESQGERRPTADSDSMAECQGIEPQRTFVSSTTSEKLPMRMKAFSSYLVNYIEDFLRPNSS